LIGYGDIPRAVFVSLFDEVQHALVFLPDAAFFEVINVGSLGVQMPALIAGIIRGLACSLPYLF